VQKAQETLNQITEILGMKTTLHTQPTGAGAPGRQLDVSRSIQRHQYYSPGQVKETLI
jgi:hypothetical protein